MKRSALLLIALLLPRPVAAQDAPAGGQPAPANPAVGNLQGRFVFQGDAPELQRLYVHEDHDLCGWSIPNESIRVGKDGGLANVAVYLLTRIRSPNPDPQEAEWNIVGCRLTPRVFVFDWRDKLVVKTYDEDGFYDLYFRRMDVRGGVDYQHDLTLAFERAERWPSGIASEYHSHMSGYILPHQNSFAAVTDETGRFRIDSLPAGRKPEVPDLARTRAARPGSQRLEVGLVHGRDPSGRDARSRRHSRHHRNAALTPERAAHALASLDIASRKSFDCERAL